MIQKSKLKSSFLKRNLKLYENKDLSEYTSFKLRSIASLVVEIYSIEDFHWVLKYLFENKINYIILGGGSNVVFVSNKIEPVVLINKTSYINLENEYLEVDSGVKNSSFLNFCVKNSIKGFEFLSGIPGTIGGAVAVNAGAFGSSISEYVIKGLVFDKNGNNVIVDKKEFEFEYRNSRFKFSNDAILRVFFKYSLGESKEISLKIKEYYEYRINNHPSYDKFSAGCFFKNPVIDGKKVSAGRLIEESGLKGYESGGFKISEKHANFILNNKMDSDFKELKDFERLVVEKVNREKGITLKREVIYIDEKGNKF